MSDGKDENSDGNTNPPDPVESTNDSNPIFGKAFGGIAFGIVFYYNEIFSSWNKCGSDNLCKAEKVVQYITVIFGVSRPAILLSQVFVNGTRRGWAAITGSGRDVINLDETSGYAGTLVNFGTYCVIEYGLSFVLDWVRYSSECLKTGDCEKDDILIWISNMKMRHCARNESDDDYDTNLKCDAFNENCVELDDENADDDHRNWCLLFFNEFPLIMLAVSVWMIYILSLDFNDKNDGGLPAPTRVPIAEGGGGQEDIIHDDKCGGDKGNKEKKDHKKKGKGDPINDDDKNEKKNKPAPAPRANKNKCTSQEIQVSCPNCETVCVVHYLDPLPIPCDRCDKGQRKGGCYCGEIHGGKEKKTSCNRKSKVPKSKRTASKTGKGPSSSKTSTSRMTDSNSQDYESLESSDSEDAEGEGFAEKECQCNAMESIQSSNEDDSDVDEEELYEFYKKFAEKHMNELLAYLEKPSYCEECGYMHIDHVHTMESDEEDLEKQIEILE